MVAPPGHPGTATARGGGKPRRGPLVLQDGQPSRSGRYFTATAICFACLLSPLSWYTIIRPRAGVIAHSALSTVTVSVADPFGATMSNMPVLIAGVNAL